MIKLIRLANEGFVNHPQKHLNQSEVIKGCYAFIEEIFPKALIYNPDYAEKHSGLIDRQENRENVLYLPEDAMIYVKNVRLNENEPYFIDNFGRSRIIKFYEAPIQGWDTDNTVQVSLGFAKERLDELKRIMEEIDQIPTDLSHTMRLIEEWHYHEVIVDMSAIQTQIAS